MKYKYVLGGIILLLITGCATKQSIKYTLDDIPVSNVAVLKNSTLDVETLADLRRGVSDNSVLFLNDRDTNIDDKHLCINSEKYYEDGTVARQISSMIVEHVRKKAIFKDVVLDNPVSADFKLAGSVKRFYGQQNTSTAARVGSQFGLIGALLTAKVKTQGAIRIELSDLRVMDKQGNVIRKIDDIIEVYDGELPADAYCWQIYWNTNDKLKSAVEKLVQELEKGSV